MRLGSSACSWSRSCATRPCAAVADGQRAHAITNGQNVIDFEKSLHTFFEPGLQQIFLSHRWTIDFANFMYLNSHFVVTTSFLVWLYIFRNQNFLLRPQHVQGRDGGWR